MSVRTFALVACAAVGLTACAGGAGSSENRTPIRALLSADALMFSSFDTDDDLNVTTAEVQAGIAREFTRADTNGDGSLQPIEFGNWSNTVLGGSQIGPYRLDFDRNVDNAITREEFESELRARYALYDQDENGSVARPDFVRLVGQPRPAPNRVRVTPQMGTRN